MYCCTTNYLKIQCPKTNTNIYHLTQILYIRIWGAAWLGWSSSSLSWIEITLSGGVVIIWRLDWGWRVYFQDGSLIRLSSWCWPPAGGLNSLPHGPLLLIQTNKPTKIQVDTKKTIYSRVIKINSDWQTDWLGKLERSMQICRISAVTRLN